MALKTVLELVNNRLPFLTAAQDTIVNDFTTEVYYTLTKWTGFVDPDIEDALKYEGTLRLLVVELVSYEMITRKVFLNMEGESGEAGTGGKKLKKGKADVMEAEFMYSKASEGNELLLEAEKLLPEIKGKICYYAAILQYNLPICVSEKKLPPPFKAYVKDIYGDLT